MKRTRTPKTRNQTEGAVLLPVRPDGLAILPTVRAMAKEYVLGRHKALQNLCLLATQRTGDSTVTAGEFTS